VIFKFKIPTLPKDWKEKTLDEMTTDTRKLVWRRQFDQLAKEHPECIDLSTKMVKHPLPDELAS